MARGHEVEAVGPAGEREQQRAGVGLCLEAGDGRGFLAAAQAEVGDGVRLESLLENDLGNEQGGGGAGAESEGA